jgi:short-subunit dehydrogenase
MNSTWIIVGATSSMARAFSRKAAENGAHILLAGRDQADMKRSAADCMVRGAPSAQAVMFDARKPGTFDEIAVKAALQDGEINVAVFVGSMPDQADIDVDPSLVDGTVMDGFMGPARLLQRLAPILEERESGTIVGIGSVAGDRGRLSNYVYGATKAGFHTYLAGLRNRMGRSGVHVMTVKPGFVDTAMTWGLDGMFLVASPDDVAQDIWKSIAKKRNTIYTPWFWRYIMLIIMHVPEFIFKKLKI